MINILFLLARTMTIYLLTTSWTVCTIMHALKWLFFITTNKILEFLVFWFKKKTYISQILLKLWLIGNRTLYHPIRPVIILVIKQIRFLLHGHPILLTTCMIMDLIRLHSVLLQLLIKHCHTEVIFFSEAIDYFINIITNSQFKHFPSY